MGIRYPGATLHGSAECPFPPTGAGGGQASSACPGLRGLWASGHHGVGRRGEQQPEGQAMQPSCQPWAPARGCQQQGASMKAGGKGSSIISGYPPACLQPSPRGHQDPTPSPLVTLSILVGVGTHFSPQPCSPSLPGVLSSPGPQGRWQRGCSIPRGCGNPGSSIRVPSSSLPGPSSRGWLRGGKGLTFQGQACYRICCWEAKPGRLSYKCLDNKDLRN